MPPTRYAFTIKAPGYLASQHTTPRGVDARVLSFTTLFKSIILRWLFLLVTAE
jgi:hypothetical protein